MPDAAPQIWAVLLIAAATVSLFFTVRRIRDGGIPPLLATGAVLFRVGLVIIGLVYATGLVHRSRAAILAAFGIAAAGAMMNLVSTVANVLAGRSRDHAPPYRADPGAPTPDTGDADDTTGRTGDDT